MRLRRKAMIMAMLLSMAVTSIPNAGAQTVSVASVETECDNENYGLNYVDEETLQIDSEAELSIVADISRAKVSRGLTEVKKLILGKDITIGAYLIQEYFPEVREIQVVPENPNYISKDGVLFDKAGTTLKANHSKEKLPMLFQRELNL